MCGLAHYVDNYPLFKVPKIVYATAEPNGNLLTVPNKNVNEGLLSLGAVLEIEIPSDKADLVEIIAPAHATLVFSDEVRHRLGASTSC